MLMRRAWQVRDWPSRFRVIAVSLKSDAEAVLFGTL